MVKAIRMHTYGGSEVLKWEDYDPGEPKPGEALIRHEAVGLNFIDVYHRTGLYPLPALPAIPGLEGAGVVDSQAGRRTARWVDSGLVDRPPRPPDTPPVQEGNPLGSSLQGVFLHSGDSLFEWY